MTNNPKFYSIDCEQEFIKTQKILLDCNDNLEFEKHKVTYNTLIQETHIIFFQIINNKLLRLQIFDNWNKIKNPFIKKKILKKNSTPKCLGKIQEKYRQIEE